MVREVNACIDNGLIVINDIILCNMYIKINIFGEKYPLLV